MVSLRFIWIIHGLLLRSLKWLATLRSLPQVHLRQLFGRSLTGRMHPFNHSDRASPVHGLWSTRARIWCIVTVKLMRVQSDQQVWSRKIFLPFGISSIHFPLFSDGVPHLMETPPSDSPCNARNTRSFDNSTGVCTCYSQFEGPLCETT